VIAAHEYLKRIPTAEFSANRFLKSVEESQIYRNLQKVVFRRRQQTGSRRVPRVAESRVTAEAKPRSCSTSHQLQDVQECEEGFRRFPSDLLIKAIGPDANGSSTQGLKAIVVRTESKTARCVWCSNSRSDGVRENGRLEFRSGPDGRSRLQYSLSVGDHVTSWRATLNGTPNWPITLTRSSGPPRSVGNEGSRPQQIVVEPIFDAASPVYRHESLPKGVWDMPQPRELSAYKAFVQAYFTTENTGSVKSACR